jgi:hypothetical protein
MAHKPNRLSHPTGTTMRIGGEVVSKINAKYDYRCAECLGPLEYWNAGLKCKADHNHRFFVHKRNVGEIQALRETRTTTVEAVYEIVDGVLKPRKEIINAH